MEEKSLARSFGDSLTEEVSGCVGEFVEIGLDSIMEDGLLKDIPFISTAISLYRIGKSIHERNHIAKLTAFLNEINNRVADEEKRQKYRNKIHSNEKFCNQELEYILIIIDRYIGFEKPQMLAKLYLAYLDETIVWDEFRMYAEVIDRIFPLDCNMLKSDTDIVTIHRNLGGESILRLAALGLMIEITNTSPFEEHGNGSIGMTIESLQRSQSKDKLYRKTEFGEKLASILR